MVRRGKHLVLRPGLDNQAVLHHHHLVGDGAHRRQVMGDQHVGQFHFFLQASQKFQDAFGHQLVERRGHLVADDEFRFRRQRAGDSDPLFLATGELRGQAVDIFLRVHLDQLEKLFHSAAFFGALEPQIEFDGPANDLADPLARIQRGIGHLVNHLDLTELVDTALAVIGRKNLVPECDLAGHRRQQAGDAACRG